MSYRHTPYILSLFGLFVKTFLVFTLLSLLGKPLFMFYHHEIYGAATAQDYVDVVTHGLPMDLSVAGYLTAFPGLLLVFSVWLKSNIVRALQKFYFGMLALLLPLIFMVDAVLYGYWGFRLDTTPLFYFFSSPQNAMASVSIWFIVAASVLFCLMVWACYVLFRSLLVKKHAYSASLPTRSYASLIMLLATAALFLPIRGSVTTSTMNIGRVYYSADQSLNHAAINPCFSLLNSYVNSIDTQHQYRFMDDAQATRLFAQLVDTTRQGQGRDIPQVLKTKRPNIVLVVLESFSCEVMGSMGGVKDVAVNMDKYAGDGVLFTNFYANSFRTDRGLTSILAAYPAQPTMSIMKYSSKTETLPMFPKALQDAGYHLAYYYGGDADFTNMRSFLVTAGFKHIVSDKDFDIKLRLSKWGVPDQYVFDKALEEIKTEQKHPFFKVIQTSSSHEPFDVPFHRLDNKILNAFAYTDDCLGRFVDGLKKAGQWNNTLLVLVPDHLGCYPEHSDPYTFEHYRIPLIFTGGAIKGAMKVPVYGSQIDIAATMLAQLNLPHNAFTFSKNMLNPHVPHFAFCTVPNAFAMVSAGDSVFFDCETNKVLLQKGYRQGKNLSLGKAYLQKLYDDISKR